MRPPSVGLITSTTWLKYVEFYTCVCMCGKKEKKKRKRNGWISLGGGIETRKMKAGKYGARRLRNCRERGERNSGKRSSGGN